MLRALRVFVVSPFVVTRLRLRQRIEIIADRSLEPDVQRVADERVADRDFLQVRQPPEERKIGQIEIVSCVHTKTQRVRQLGGISVSSEARFALAGFERACKRLRIQLDPIAAHRCGPPDRVGNGIDEHTDADPDLFHPADDGFEIVYRSVCGPAGLARDFTWHHRYEGALRRPDLQHQLEEIGARIALDVVLDLRGALQRLGDVVHIRASDVTLVRTWMNGNAWNARRDAHGDSLEHVGFAAASRVAQRRNLVNVRR